MDRAEAEEKGLFHVIGKEIDDRYMEELKKLVLSPDEMCIRDKSWNQPDECVYGDQGNAGSG